jgi:hypothetical protein
LKETGHVMRNFLDTMMVDFLNTPLFRDLDLKVYRVLGPNFHFISFAYAVAFFCVVLFAIGRWWVVALALPLMVITGSKGALVFVFLVMAVSAAAFRIRGSGPLWMCLAMLAVYGFAGVTMGIAMTDYHVLGFMAGVRSLVVNPIGGGIGAGGNLAVDTAAIDWSRSQQLGSVEPVVESALGVLFHQMGVFAFVLVFALIWLALRLWRLYLKSRDRPYAATAFAILTVTVNGIFQEEALFAPLAMGLVLALAGVLLGRAYRPMLPAGARVRHVDTLAAPPGRVPAAGRLAAG